MGSSSLKTASLESRRHAGKLPIRTAVLSTSEPEARGDTVKSGLQTFYDFIRGGEFGRLKPRAQILLSVFVAHANGSRLCWPSQETLAAESGLALPTVRKGLRDLEGAALIKKAKLPAKLRRKVRSQCYRLRLAQPPDTTKERENSLPPKPDEGEKRGPPGGKLVTPKEVIKDLELKSNSTSNSEVASATAQAAAAESRRTAIQKLHKAELQDKQIAALIRAAEDRGGAWESLMAETRNFCIDRETKTIHNPVGWIIHAMDVGGYERDDPDKPELSEAAQAAIQARNEELAKQRKADEARLTNPEAVAKAKATLKNVGITWTKITGDWSAPTPSTRNPRDDKALREDPQELAACGNPP